MLDVNPIGTLEEDVEAMMSTSLDKRKMLVFLGVSVFSLISP